MGLLLLPFFVGVPLLIDYSLIQECPHMGVPLVAFIIYNIIVICTTVKEMKNETMV